MASDLEKSAKEAFIDDHYELAIDLYSQAIALDPLNAQLFADRAQANIKLQNFTATYHAVSDANKAIELDPKMAKAYFRKGTACLKLEEYQTAKTALETGASLAPEDSRFPKLIKECEKSIAEEDGAVPAQASQMVPEKDTQTVSVADPVATVIPAKPKYRHEYYQKPEEVVVTIFAKGIPASSVAVDFGEQILSAKIDVPGEDAFHFQTRLFGKIMPDKCKHVVMSTKIEIRLAKAETIQWPSLEFSKESSAPRKLNNVLSGGASQRPSYPSSKPRNKDWDKLEAEVKKEEKDEKLDGDAALNKFFRGIFQDADEDTRRAMQKSFLESNGTVLSTDWKDVGKKKVEGSAPDGMEIKKWEY